MKNSSQSTSPLAYPAESPPFADILRQTGEKCTECMACVRKCKFLQQWGTPKKIAASFAAGTSDESLQMAFQCSLCRLCTAVCPAKLDPAELFLRLRRRAEHCSRGNLQQHRRLASYERRGTSPLFSLYMLPEKCRTVLFPGCALPGSRPQRVKDLYTCLQKKEPRLGIVLDCCTKPSHDLGRAEYFNAMFEEMVTYLRRKAIEEVLVACPSCHWTFAAYAPELRVRTVYDVLAESPPPTEASTKTTVTVHDPCSIRFAPQIQEAARRLTAAAGLTVAEMRHRGKKTLCCGEGGAVGFVLPENAAAWTKKRQQEAGDIPIVTYCAGCTAFLGRKHTVHHLLDLYFAPERTLTGGARVTRSPFTYLNRLLLKRWFKKHGPKASVRLRTFRG